MFIVLVVRKVVVLVLLGNMGNSYFEIVIGIEFCRK